jgi:hypothetical protein
MASAGLAASAGSRAGVADRVGVVGEWETRTDEHMAGPSNPAMMPVARCAGNRSGPAKFRPQIAVERSFSRASFFVKRVEERNE